MPMLPGDQSNLNRPPNRTFGIVELMIVVTCISVLAAVLNRFRPLTIPTDHAIKTVFDDVLFLTVRGLCIAGIPITALHLGKRWIPIEPGQWLWVVVGCQVCVGVAYLALFPAEIYITRNEVRLMGLCALIGLVQSKMSWAWRAVFAVMLARDFWLDMVSDNWGGELGVIGPHVAFPAVVLALICLARVIDIKQK